METPFKDDNKLTQRTNPYRAAQWEQGISVFSCQN